MNPRYGVLWGLLASSVALTTCTDCRKPVSPSDVEGGITVVDTTCRFLQGITDDGNVLAVCATIEEIAFVVSILAPLLAASPPAKEECEHVPTTDLCATPQQMGVAIKQLILRRRNLLLLPIEGGP